jgi:hypothetical protein
VLNEGTGLFVVWHQGDLFLAAFEAKLEMFSCVKSS